MFTFLRPRHGRAIGAPSDPTPAADGPEPAPASAEARPAAAKAWPGSSAGGSRAGLAYGPFAVWAGLIAVAFGVGAVLRVLGALPVDALPPLHAHARLLVIPLLPAALLAVAGVVALPSAARRLRWPLLLIVSCAASAAWAVALQAPDGLSRPLTSPPEYLTGLPAMGDHPLSWLRGFTTHLREYPTHVKGHPPLPMLILWILRWTSLGGPGWAAAVVIAAGASSTAAIAITVRALADEPTARRALPFLILAPTAIWIATSMDAVFLGASSWSVALLSRAASRGGEGGPRPPWGAIPLPWSRPVDGGNKRFHRLWITVKGKSLPRSGQGTSHISLYGSASTPRPAHTAETPERDGPPGGPLDRSSVRGSTSPEGVDRTRARDQASNHPLPTALGALGGALAGGLLAGSLPYLSYGLVTILALPLAVLLLTRPRRPLLIAFGLGCLVVPVAFTLAGFRWWDGVMQTHAAWAAGAGARRPYAYFLVGDLAVLALVIGPAAALALPYVLRAARRPDTAALGILLGAVLLGVLALDLSGVTRGEVERIWLPYAAWLTAGAAVHRAPARRMLIGQVVTALLIQALVESPW